MAVKKTIQPKPEYQMLRVRKDTYNRFKKMALTSRVSIMNLLEDSSYLLEKVMVDVKRAGNK